jgi:hypothetical protein
VTNVGSRNVVAGYNTANITGDENVVFGFAASTSAGVDQSVVMGENAIATGDRAVAIGNSASAGTDSIAIGPSASAATYSIAIGYAAVATTGQLVFAGHSTTNLTDIFFSKNTTSAETVTIHGGRVRAASANANGGDLVIAGGLGYGLEGVGGLPGAVTFATGDPASAGTTTTAHTSTNRWQIATVNTGNGGGNFVPIADNTYDIGSTSLYVKSAYSMNFIAKRATNAAVTGAVNLDHSLGGILEHTLTGNTTYTYTNAKAGATLTLAVIQGGVGSFTITWPSTVKWVGASAPTLSTVAGRRDVFRFYSDGTNLYEVSRAIDVR